MTVIQTADLDSLRLSRSEHEQTYCGLDCCVTWEVREALQAQFPSPPLIYDFERALQGPYMEMMLGGFRVDELARQRACQGLIERLAHIHSVLNELVTAYRGFPINEKFARSRVQLIDFFYKEMGLPEQWTSQKGQRKLSMNREVLEKLEVYLYARPIIACILAFRDLAKQLDTLSTQIDSDGRFRTSYNIAGTRTGRPSSSTGALGTGDNAQNIAPGLRYVFVSDQGYKLVHIDLEQTEARDVGWFCGVLFGDWTYLDSCESGDLHTNNARLIWARELPWTGDPKSDRAIADRIFYRDFTFRDMAKRGGHLSNYMGTAWTASRHLKVPQDLMEEFQKRYVHGPEAAYPCIRQFWQWVAQQLQTTHQLTTPWGRRRHFFGRPGEDKTLRDAIAFLPQSTTADRMSLGMWRVWKYLPEAKLLAETYDSITFQVLEGPGFDDTVAKALELIRVPIEAHGRVYVVPGEAKVGWNWGQAVTVQDQERARQLGKRVPRLNPDGLVKWKPGGDLRQRQVGLGRAAL